MLTETLCCDATAVCRVYGPVVVFQHMHELKHSAHSTNCVVDGCCANELSRQVCIQRELHLEWDYTHIHVLSVTNATAQCT